MWISVDERLPRVGLLVLIRGENGKVVPARVREIWNPDTGVFEKKWYIRRGRDVGKSKITHWRPGRLGKCRSCGGNNKCNF